MKKILLMMLAAIMAVAGYSREEQDKVYDNDGRHKGLDFNISTGYHVGLGDFKKVGMIPAEVGLGKQFHPNMYIGLTSGVWLGTKDTKPMIPVAANVKLMLPLQTTMIKPILGLKLGYLINMASSDGGSQSVQTDYGMVEMDMPKTEVPDFIMMEIMPGLQVALSKKSDFMISAGYAHAFATKGSGGGGFFVVKAGLNFHKDALGRKRPPREKVETRSRGLQFTLEGNGNVLNSNIGGGFALACTYKINPHLSLGGGLGYETFGSFGNGSSGYIYDEGSDVQIINTNGSDIHTEMRNFSGSINSLRLFARGTYRFTDRKFSPMISVDLGVRNNSFDDDVYSLSYYGNDELKNMVEKPSSIALYASPSIGLSMRTTKNSYLELKGGFQITPSIGGEKVSGNGYYASLAKKSLSSPWLSFGFTHTFGKLGKRMAY